MVGGKMRKIIGIDIETAGLDCKRHGIIQIGMFVDIDGKLEDTLLVNVQPFATDIVATSPETELEFNQIVFLENPEEIIIQPSKSS